MAIDFGNIPVGDIPTPEQIQQIKDVLLLGNVENISISTWAGSPNIQINSSQVLDFTTSVNSLLSPAVSGSPNWNSTYTTVRANSAAWNASLSSITPIIFGGTGSTTISGARSNFKTPASDATGIVGAFEIKNIVVIAQADYDNIVSPLSSTLYHII